MIFVLFNFLQYLFIFESCSYEFSGWKPLHIAVFQEMEVKDKTNDEVEKNKKVGNEKDAKSVTEKGPLMVVCPLYVKYDRYGQYVFQITI